MNSTPVSPKGRFTLDGSLELENRLADICDQIVEQLSRIIPASRLEAVILGGGYGRGEGGVLNDDAGDQPYNDLEFFVFIQGAVLLSEKRYGTEIHDLGHRLTEEFGIEVEFKILSLERLRESEPSMFFYDLVLGHRVVAGKQNALEDFSMHGDAALIPLHEASRLLLNRCSGLLFSLERLELPSFGSEDADFVGRNLAKAQLALGDVVLAAEGRYHWSCIERHRRLLDIQVAGLPMENIRSFHQAGKQFKLHPVRNRDGQKVLAQQHLKVSQLAWQVWRWLEEKRLGERFESPLDYSASVSTKCPESRPVKNLVIRIRTFGLKGILNSKRFRYPREALYNSLPLLLWERESFGKVGAIAAKELKTAATDWRNVLEAYKSIWSQFN